MQRFCSTASSNIQGRATHSNGSRPTNGTPVVTGIDQDWGHVHLLCSDGLTKHVSDERIAERLRTMTSAEQVCKDLLQDALDDGGSDNISIIVGRTIKPE